MDVLGANIAIISGYLSLSLSLGYTFIKLVMVENSGFAVEISMMSLTVSAEF